MFYKGHRQVTNITLKKGLKGAKMHYMHVLAVPYKGVPYKP